jgi:hypothetical protein
MKSETKSVKVECEDCRGTGLYCGMCERKGEAVVCLLCRGQGWHEVRYRVFTGRKLLRGVKSIRQSRGGFIGARVGGHGEAMTYKQFEQKFPPRDR